MEKSSKVTIHMVSSLDGYIAKKDDDVSWLQSQDHFEKGIALTEEAIEEFLNKIDCYVMGANTYEHALKIGWPYGDKPVYVISHRLQSSDRTNVNFYAGDLDELINHQLKSNYQHIWMAGGAALAKDFVRNDLADDIILSIMPIILGDGVPFFDHIGKEQKLHLKDVTTYNDGMVELWYQVLK